MKKAVNYLTGQCPGPVESPYPERLVNICAKNEIEFWDLERFSPTTVHISCIWGSFESSGPWPIWPGLRLKR